MKKLIKIIIVLLIVVSLLILLKEYKLKKNKKDVYLSLNNEEGLYAHVIPEIDTKDAWQNWETYTGMNSKHNYKYFLLPKNSDDNYIEIYNNFSEDIMIDNVTILSKKIAKIEYKEGEEIIVSSKNGYSSKLLIYKSNADASVFINDDSGLYKNFEGKNISTDLYSFLIQDKRNSVKDIKCTILSDNGVINTTIKKMKGRGNSTWEGLPNKPFNITFYEPTVIGNTNSKKFSILSNGSDSTFLRNKIMYDFANEVGLLYSPNSSYIDLYVNGIYKGCYLACQKVDLGKNSLVSLKDNSDKLNSNFNFLVEVDCWNYYDDVFFVTDNGYHIVIKTPDLDGYDENDINMKEKYEFIKNTYQNFENILYHGTLEELEKICDIESLAKMYLIHEFGKNCDGGFSSTFFTYNADNGKFYASPIWDCDSALGAFDLIKEGYTMSACNYKGWLTKNATYHNVLNPFGQCFNIQGKTSDGKTFEEICIEIWNEKFKPAINVILGENDSTDNLKSIEEYKEKYKKAIYNNYIIWKIRWFCYSEASRIGKEYNLDYNGEVDFLKDWIKARSDWMDSMLNYGNIEEDETSYYLVGENIGGWDNKLDSNKLTKNNDGTYYITKKFDANVEYKLKIKDDQDRYYSCNYYDDITLKYGNVENYFWNLCFKYENDVELTIILDGDYFKIIPTDYSVKPISSEKKDIYFKNTLGWKDVYYYCCNGKYMFLKWPGIKAEFVNKSEDGFDIYKAEVNVDMGNIIFNDGEMDEKTEEIEIKDEENICMYKPTELDMYRNIKIYKVIEELN